MTESRQQQPEVTEKDLPSLDLIYPLALESYETARQRMITQDNRIQQIITLTLAITGAIPAIYQAFGISPRMPFFYAALALFVVGLGLLVTASMRNYVDSLTVSTLHKHYIGLPNNIAKEALIKYAGEADEKNAKYMIFRHRLILGATFSLALEILALVLSGVPR